MSESDSLFASSALAVLVVSFAYAMEVFSGMCPVRSLESELHLDLSLQFGADADQISTSSTKSSDVFVVNIF